MTMQTGRVLPNLAQQAQAELEALRAENARLRELAAKANGQRAISMKVSEKGALSVYGLGRFPVTLYRGQWERLIKASPQIVEFIRQNAEHLSVKE